MSEYQNYSPPPAKPSSTLAIVSLVAGILGFLQFVPLIGPIVAIITGHMAKNEIKSSLGELGGDGMATAGLVLGYGTLAIALCIICVVFGLVAFGLLTIPIFEASSF